MKYIGNKAKLMDWINEVLKEENIVLKDKIVLDGFMGTGSFAKNAIDAGAKKIYGCELLKSMCLYAKYNILGIKYNEFLNVKKAFLENTNKEGYFYKNFSTNSGRNFFSNENSKKIDSMLNKWNNFNDIQKGLAIDMIDRVSNTSGTYGAFLKIWRSMALKKIEEYNPSDHFSNESNEKKIKIWNKGVEFFNKKVDIAYLDPPYNTRQYGAYYHVLERIVDRKNNIKSKTGVTKDDSNSTFCKKGEHKLKIKKLIDELKANIIIISYNNEGLITEDEWKEILNNYNYKIFKKEYRRFKTNSLTKETTKNNDKLEEILFVIRKY